MTDKPTAGDLTPETQRMLRRSLDVTISITVPNPTVREDAISSFYAGFNVDLAPEDIPQADGEILDALGMYEDDEARIGYASGYVADRDHPEFVDDLDNQNAAAGGLAQALKETDLSEALGADMVFEDVLIVDSCVTAPQWRNASLGLIGTGMMLREMQRGCGLAALYPFPMLEKEDQHRAEELRGRLQKHWARLGFQLFADEYLGLDLGTVVLERRLNALIDNG